MVNMDITTITIITMVNIRIATAPAVLKLGSFSSTEAKPTPLSSSPSP
jgi:hypothetical protein